MFDSIVQSLRASKGIAAKTDIATVTARLGLSGKDTIRTGDDCAAIPDGNGYLLFAIEGFINEFVAADPWFAGWCGVMVNVSDIAARGGRPIAVVDAVWANGEAAVDPILQGLKAAAAAFSTRLVPPAGTSALSQASVNPAAAGSTSSSSPQVTGATRETRLWYASGRRPVMAR